MAQLERVRAEQYALKAEQVASQKALSAAAEVLQDGIRGLSRQWHELISRQNENVRFSEVRRELS